jgi:glucosylceramidase
VIPAIILDRPHARDAVRSRRRARRGRRLGTHRDDATTVRRPARARAAVHALLMTSRMRTTFTATGLGLCLAACSGSPDDGGASLGQAQSSNTVHVWLTTPGNDLAEASPLKLGGEQPGKTVIVVDDARTFQSVQGFGASMTDSSAWLLTTELSAADRDEVMHDLFDRKRGIGISVLRQPLGASDETHDGRYSFDDVPGGDMNLDHFSIAHDVAYILPRIREAIAIDPDLWILGTPWSPPGWMKTNGSMLNPGNDGKLRGDAYGAFARYLVESIEAYDAHGVHVAALTPQNEPGQATNYPGMDLSEGAEATLIVDFLAPALKRAGLEGKVDLLGYDYNWPYLDRAASSFPGALLGDDRANRVVAGLAFHCYGGDPAAMTALHESHPDKDLYVTECTSAAQVRGHGEAIEQLIMSMRNWARTFVTWNVALHADGEPHQGSGCNGCIGLVSIDGGVARMTRDYAQLGHASKFVARGARVIASTPSRRFAHHEDDGIPVEDVAFLNPDGTHVLVVYDWTDGPADLEIRSKGGAFDYTLGAHEAVTFTW